MEDTQLRAQLIRLAHQNPDMQQVLLPLLTKTAGAFEEAVKGKKFPHPTTHNQVQFSSLPADEQKRIRQQWQQESAKKEKPESTQKEPTLEKGHKKPKSPKSKGLHVRNVMTPRYDGPMASQAKEVVEQYGLKDKDMDDFADWRRGKPEPGKRAMNWDKLKAAYLQHAKPETKKRMQNMTGAEFKAMYLSIVHKDDMEGME